MTFRITCPVCGARDLYEFRYGGEDRGPRPAQEDLAPEDHFRWAQFRMTRPEPREEWWVHAAGCGVWFSTSRDPATNREERTEPPANPTVPGAQEADEARGDDADG